MFPPSLPYGALSRIPSEYPNLSSDTANLVANLVTPKVPYQLISSIEDFITTGSTACVINRASHAAFLQQAFPRLARDKILMVPSTSINVLLNYVKSGRCQGAVSTNVHLEYGMGLGDIKGEFCDIVYTGSDLGVGFYALPFNLRIPHENITAYSVLVNAAISVR